MRRRALALFIATALVIGATLGTLIVLASVTAQCRSSQHSYDALHRVIERAYQAPDPAKVPPALRPFIDPQAIDRQRRSVEAVQGPRPAC